MNLNLSTNKSITTSRRKAAILLMYLDSKMPGLSQQLFAKMGESRSKMLLHEINQLGKVDKTEISHVMDEFYELAITQNSVIGGKNVTDKLLKDSFGIEDPDDFFSSKSGLFDFINHLSDKILIDYLKKENRQVAALVLSLIPDERSAKLLSEFPVEQTAIISKKMLTLDVPNYPLLWEILVALSASSLIYYFATSAEETTLFLPFFKDFALQLGIWFILFSSWSFYNLIVNRKS